MRSADAMRRIASRASLFGLLVVLAGCASAPFSWDKFRGIESTDAVAAPAPATPSPSPTPRTAEPDPAPVAANPRAPASSPAPSTPVPLPVEPAAPTLAERAAAILRQENEVPPAAQRAFDAAREALRAGRVDEAERGFRALATEHPELGGAQANLGLIYRQSGKLAESAAALEAAVKANPKQAAYANQLGITYRQQGEFKKAREAYETAIELDPDYASAVLNLGILSDLYLWDGARALELYERYVALKPGGDAVVSKWITDLKNRKPKPITVSRKEQP